MRANIFPTLLPVLLAHAICCPLSIGAEPPRQLYLSGDKTPLQAVASPGTVPGYVKKDTCGGITRASRTICERTQARSSRPSRRVALP
jgi:hypothetical protein